MIGYVLKNNKYVPPDAPRFTGRHAKAMEPGYCAWYARLASLIILTGSPEDPFNEIWNPSWRKGEGAWEYIYNHESAWAYGRDNFLDINKLYPGQLFFIRIPYSPSNNRRDSRNNLVRGSHLATYVNTYTIDGMRHPWIWHNVWGEIRSESLNHFINETGSILLNILNPRDKSVLKR